MNPAREVIATVAERVRLKHSSDFKDHRTTTWECRCGWSTADRHAPVALFKRHVEEMLADSVLAALAAAGLSITATPEALRVVEIEDDGTSYVPSHQKALQMLTELHLRPLTPRANQLRQWYAGDRQVAHADRIV